MSRPETMTGAEYLAAMAKKGGRRWSNAKRTRCAQGHAHLSQLESRVCSRLTIEATYYGCTLFQQVRLPCWNLAPDDRGRPRYCSVDFAMVKDGRLCRLIEAKGRVSRDWTRGAAAVEACYGLKIETVTK